jgi:uncharacterized Fe-S center protein
MEKAKVYFTSMRTKVGESMLEKLEKLIKKAGIDTIDFKQKYAAIKIHFGEPGNLAFLRPNFAKTVADHIKKQGGMPFLTDCNTLYVGRRNNAIVHMDAANENGYSPLSTGVQNIIADGLKGTDDIDLPVPGGKLCKVAHVGRALADADIIISLAHFKLHEMAGIGGTIKNVGMGGGSRAGKMHMHNDGKPQADKALCKGCKVCSKYCQQKAISYGDDKKAFIDHNKCVGCGRCIGVCNFHAIENTTDTSVDNLNKRMVEYCKAIVDGKPLFHICVVNQVSPYCDCHGESDAPIVADIGIFAGFDPVAVDAACADAVNAAPLIENSIASDRERKHGDHFKDIHPITNWRVQISHGEEIGLGTGQYELVTVK